MKHVFSLVVALVIVMLWINTISVEVVPEAQAVATWIEGNAFRFTKEAPEGRLIKNNDIISKNDRVEVQENSRLELRFPDGSYLRLSENARFTMRLLQFEKRTDSLYLQAFLGAGKLWAKIKKLSTSGSRVEVITSTGPAAAKDTGTVYGVDLEEDTSTTIKVYEGAVLAMSAAREAPQTVDQTSAPAEGQLVSVNVFQKVSVSSQGGVSQPQDFDPKATINDWIRWNLQRDAREGLVSITVTPASSTITRGVSLQFTGTAYYPDNIAKDITWFATWGSSDAKVAAIDQAGAARGAELGTSGISAAIVDISGSTVLNVTRELVSITVTPVSRSIVNGSVLQFTAMAKFSDKTVQNITSSAVWKSSDTHVAVVNARGLATAGDKAGTAVISASLGNKTGSTALKVRRELLSITVIPGGATIMEGKTQQFNAIGNYSDKTTQNLTSAAKWQTSDAKIAGITPAGLVIGKTEAGTAAITASFGGKVGSGTITVSKIALASLIVRPAEATIRQMMSQQFTVMGSFSDGSTKDLTRSVAWTSSAPLLAPIKATGAASGILTGSIVITATSQGKSASAKLEVTEREIYRPRADEETAKKFVFWPAPRFAKVAGTQPARGSVVIDHLTGLLWTADAASPGPLACSPGVTKTWQAALVYVACLNSNSYLGYRNWRLPSREELFGLVDYKQSVPNPWVYTHGFSYTQAFYGYDVWFSSGRGDSSFTSYFDISRGVMYYTDGSKSFYVWPVRSGK
jgi:hypothetical protein